VSEHPTDWNDPVSIPDVDTGFDLVMVPFDGSRSAERALAYATRLADITGAEVVVVVGYDPPVTVRRRGALTLESLRAEMEEEANELATEAVEAIHSRGQRARGIVVRGDIVDAILETAEAESADILILGRQGLSHEMRTKGNLRELGHGSVTDRVVRLASIPVLVVG
jgi:nucleotide-binding universal stress UspA family protein